MLKLVRVIDEKTGMFLYDDLIEEGTELQSNQIDVEVPAGLHLPKWVDGAWVEGKEALLEELKQAKVDAFNSLCNSTILSGLTSDASGETLTYAFDYEAQQNLSGALSAFNAGLLTTVDWTAVEKRVTLDKSQFTKLFADAMVRKDTLIKKYHTLKDDIMNALDKDTLDKITWE